MGVGRRWDEWDARRELTVGKEREEAGSAEEGKKGGSARTTLF